MSGKPEPFPSKDSKPSRVQPRGLAFRSLNTSPSGPPFNHTVAVAAAKDRANEVRVRARMFGLAKLLAIANHGEITGKQQLLQIRQRKLEQFIGDPYSTSSLLHIGFERDRRANLEADMSL